MFSVLKVMQASTLRRAKSVPSAAGHLLFPFLLEVSTGRISPVRTAVLPAFELTRAPRSRLSFLVQVERTTNPSMFTYGTSMACQVRDTTYILI